MTTARPSYEQPPTLSRDSMDAPQQKEPQQKGPEKEWPTMYDLPSEYPEEDGLPDKFHNLQPELLSDTLRLPTVAEDQIFTGSDFNVYYDRSHPTWHKRPDWFAVAGVPRLYGGTDLRLSYVVWDEQVIPFIAVELLSPKTKKSDLGETEREPDGTPTKWEVYEQILQVPTYVIFNRIDHQFRVFTLVDGRYQEQDVSSGRFWLADMRIGIGVWQGEFKGHSLYWLRWYDASGEWIPTEAEAERQQREVAEQMAEQERSRADQEQLRAEQERSRAEQERSRAEQEQLRAEQERSRAEQEQLRAEQEHSRAEQEQLRAEQERSRAEQERSRAEQERSRAERLAEKLRELGINPDEA